MASDVREADVRDVLKRYHAYYEVRPYYVVLDRRPAAAPRMEQRVQAGFDVNLYGALEKEQLPLFRSEGARKAVTYFESVAQEVQSQAGQRCTVEIIPYADSIVFETISTFSRGQCCKSRLAMIEA